MCLELAMASDTLFGAMSMAMLIGALAWTVIRDMRRERRWAGIKRDRIRYWEGR